jgi:hypothetical protein
LAGGIPSDAYLKIELQDSGGATYPALIDPQSPFPPMTLSADDLARQILTPGEMHRSVNGVRSISVMDGKNLRFVRSHSLEFTIHLTDSVVLTNVSLRGFDISASPVSDLTGLPAEFREAVQKKLDEIRSSPPDPTSPGRNP